MDNADLNVLRQVAQWLDDGQRVVLGTVTRTWGSAPRPVGSLVAVCAGDGGPRIAGSVSGGCIEDDLVERIARGEVAIGAPQLLRYGVDADESSRFGLPCGGSIELLLEPLGAHSRMAELLALLDRGERVRRVLTLADGAVSLHDGAYGSALTLDATSLTTTHGPRWRLLVIGAGQMTHYLASFALALDYAVSVCDPRPEHGQDWALPEVPLLREMPDDAVLALRPDAHSAIVALTHDAKIDDMALMEALRSDAFYVGAIGSQSTQAKRRARLQEHFGISDEQLARLHGPVGLKYGARTPPEIAVAILAELTATRYGYRIAPPVRVADPL